MFHLVPGLENGKRYRLWFWARAERACTIPVVAEMANSPNEDCGLGVKMVRLDTTFTGHYFDFVAKNGDRGPIRIPSFLTGKEKNKIYAYGTMLVELP
jgi:hypothetical protein